MVRINFPQRRSVIQCHRAPKCVYDKTDTISRIPARNEPGTTVTLLRLFVHGYPGSIVISVSDSRKRRGTQTRVMYTYTYTCNVGEKTQGETRGLTNREAKLPTTPLSDYQPFS